MPQQPIRTSRSLDRAGLLPSLTMPSPRVTTQTTRAILHGSQSPCGCPCFLSCVLSPEDPGDPHRMPQHHLDSGANGWHTVPALGWPPFSTQLWRPSALHPIHFWTLNRGWPPSPPAQVPLCTMPPAQPSMAALGYSIAWSNQPPQ